MQRNYVEETAVITEELIAEYKSYLYKEEKSRNTVSKYIRDIRAFSAFIGRRAGQKRKIFWHGRKNCRPPTARPA